MKKIIFFGLFMAFGCFSFGQEYQLETGINAGIKLYSVVTPYSLYGQQNNPVVSNLSIGPDILINVSKKISLKTGFNYTPENLMWFNYDDLDGNIHKYYASTLTIPVLARYYCGNNKLQFFIEGGPYLNINSGQVRIYKFDNDASPIQTYSSTEHIFGLAVGAGLKYQLRPNLNINLEATCHNDLQSIMDLNFGNKGFTNITLGIGYSFLKKKADDQK